MQQVISAKRLIQLYRIPEKYEKTKYEVDAIQTFNIATHQLKFTHGFRFGEFVFTFNGLLW